MTLYEVLALLHILAAITWVGGGLAINVLSSRIHRAGGPAVAAFTRQAE